MSGKLECGECGTSIRDPAQVSCPACGMGNIIQTSRPAPPAPPATPPPLPPPTYHPHTPVSPLRRKLAGAAKKPGVKRIQTSDLLWAFFQGGIKPGFLGVLAGLVLLPILNYVAFLQIDNAWKAAVWWLKMATILGLAICMVQYSRRQIEQLERKLGIRYHSLLTATLWPRYVVLFACWLSVVFLFFELPADWKQIVAGSDQKAEPSRSPTSSSSRTTSSWMDSARGDSPARHSVHDPSGGEIIGSYMTRISRSDQFNSRGVDLRDLPEIKPVDFLIQDRFNFHQLGRADSEDRDEGLYTRYGPSWLRDYYQSTPLVFMPPATPNDVQFGTPLLMVTLREHQIEIRKLDN